MNSFEFDFEQGNITIDNIEFNFVIRFSNIEIECSYDNLQKLVNIASIKKFSKIIHKSVEFKNGFITFMEIENPIDDNVVEFQFENNEDMAILNISYRACHRFSKQLEKYLEGFI